VDSILGARDLGANNKTPDCSQRLYSVLLVQGGFNLQYTGDSMEVSNFMGTTSSVGSMLSDRIKTIAIEKNSQRSSIAIVKDKPNAKEADAIIADCMDLIDDQKFKPFFYKKLYELGKGRFLEQAYKARKYHRGSPGRFFVHLLK
jgi:hypothetical protein